MRPEQHRRALQRSRFLGNTGSNASNAVLAHPRTRHRTAYGLAVVLTIAAGLASRRWPGLLPEALGKYPGDALYAVMIYWLVALARPRDGIARSGLLALAICFAIEFLQLWQPHGLQAIRATTIGHLVLGSHFHALDLFAYAIGVPGAMAAETLLVAWAMRAALYRVETEVGE